LQVLRKKAIVFSIHQPSSEVFVLFDKLTLLNKGPEGYGRLIYFGSAPHAVSYFENLGYPFQGSNPAEYLMDICAGKGQKEEEVENLNDSDSVKEPLSKSTVPRYEVEEEKIEAGTVNQFQSNSKLIDAFTQTNNYQQTITTLDRLHHRLPPPHHLTKEEKEIEKGDYQGIYPTPWHFQLQILLKRTYLNLVRTPAFLSVRVFRFIFFGLFIGITYLQIGLSQTSIQDRASLIFLSIITSFTGGMGLIPTFIDDRNLVTRERAAKLYRVSVYMIANLATVIPFDILNVITYSSIVYWMCNLNPQFDRFLFFVLALFLTNLTIGGFILVVSAFSPDNTIASTIAPMLFSIWLIYSGFLVLQSNIQVWLIWLNYISPYKYALQALFYNEFDGLKFECETATTCAYPNGNDYLKLYSMDSDTRLMDIAILILFLLFFRFLNYLCLRFRRFDKR